MSKIDFTIFENTEERAVWGLSKQSNDKTQAKDIPALSKKYYEAINKNSGEVIPFFIVSRDYDKETKDFMLFIGGLIENANLESFTIPKGLYGKVTIKPKMGFMWALSIGEAKRAFYTDWLQKSDYTPLNMEYEYHTEISKEKNPHIDILFAVKKRID
jgi:predicted transcriptional regulator YdeE